MESNNLFHTLLELRAASLATLPVTAQVASRIRYDIILLLSASWSRDECLTIKQLYAQLPHSQSAIRHHFDFLLDGGWLHLEDDDSDRRIRYVVPSEKLVRQIMAWEEKCSQVLDKYKSNSLPADNG